MSVREVYQKTRKVPDLFWNTYVCRPPAAAIVYAIAGTRVTPNQITLLAFVIALVAGAGIALLPGYWGVLAGVLLYELSYVFDCVDGMLARWRQVQSTAGHLLDFLMDEIKAFVILGAVAVRLYLDHGAVLYLLLGILGLVVLATGIAITTFVRRPEIAGPKPSAPASPAPRSLVRRVLAVPEAAAKFLIHYPSYILYAAIAGDLRWYFYPYIAVNALYAARALLGVFVRFGRA